MHNLQSWLSLYFDGKIERIGDEAERVRALMHCAQLRRIARCETDFGAQNHPFEPTAAGRRVLDHDPFGMIDIISDDQSGLGGEVQEPQFVTGGDAGEQQLFGIPASRIAAESGVGRSFYVGMPSRMD